MNQRALIVAGNYHCHCCHGGKSIGSGRGPPIGAARHLPPVGGTRYPRLTLMHVRGRGLGADFGGEVVGLNRPHRDATDLRISEFHVRHMRLLRHQRLQAVAAFIQILDQ